MTPLTLFRKVCVGLNLPLEASITALSLYRRASPYFHKPNEINILLPLACTLLASKVQEFPQTIGAILSTYSSSPATPLLVVSEDDIQQMEMLLLVTVGFDSLVGESSDFDTIRVFMHLCEEEVGLVPTSYSCDIQARGWEYLHDSLWLDVALLSVELTTVDVACACFALAARDCQLELEPQWWERCGGHEKQIEDIAWEIYRTSQD